MRGFLEVVCSIKSYTHYCGIIFYVTCSILSTLGAIEVKISIQSIGVSYFSLLGLSMTSISDTLTQSVCCNWDTGHKDLPQYDTTQCINMILLHFCTMPCNYYT